MAEKPTQAPHTVPAGIMDDFLGNKGPNGELMHQGKPALVVDLPDEDEDEEDSLLSPSSHGRAQRDPGDPS